MFSKNHMANSKQKTSQWHTYPLALLRMLSKGCLSVFIFMLHIYRWTISPLLGRTCRFYPSCSEYALCALREHKWKGLWLIIIRLLKCGPWHPGGVDFVPNCSSQESSVFDPNAHHHEIVDSDP